MAGDNAGALRCYEAALQHSPSFPPALHGAGVIALCEGRIADACRLLGDAARADQSDVQIQYDLAEACRLGLDWKAAADQYQRVLDARPGILAARQGFAESLLRLGRHEDAREPCRLALEAGPNDPRSLLLAAEMAMHLDVPSLAERHARDAMLLDPSDRRAGKCVVQALIAQQRHDEAEELLLPLLDPVDQDTQQFLVELVAGRARLDPSFDPVVASATPGVAAAIAERPSFSIIICSVDRAKFDAVVGNYRTLLGGSVEIIGIHDARSLCEGYNRGTRQARGDLLVFSHDDIEVLTPDFGERLKHHLSVHDVVGACGTNRLVKGEAAGHWMGAGWPHLRGLVAHHYPSWHEMAGWYRVLVLDTLDEPASGGLQGLDGMFMAARREVLERCRFDEDTFDGFHLYDLDFSFSAYQAGFDVAVFRDISMIHYTYGESPGYQQAFERYQALFEAKHAGSLVSPAFVSRRFIPALCRTKRQVRRFCEDLLTTRRKAAGIRMPD